MSPMFPVGFLLQFDTKVLKGTYYAKITFIRCEHSCMAAVCENNQPIMVKIHQLIFL